MTQVSVLDLGGEQKKKPIEFVKVIRGHGSILDAEYTPKAYDKVRLISRDSMDVIAAWDEGRDITRVSVYLGHWNDGVVE